MMICASWLASSECDPMVDDEIEITVYDQSGAIVSKVKSKAQTATQIEIDEMVALIESGSPAWLAAALVLNKERDCYQCKHAAADPDGPYCGHPESFKQTMFGRGFNSMRNPAIGPQAVCGLEGKLWEKKDA
jgi:hypothetical protein